MTKAPVTYRDYYRRWIKAFSLDLFRLGVEQVLGALLALIILFFQWRYGLIPQGHGWQAVKSVGWPYLILLAALCFISVVRAPVILDRKRSTEIDQLGGSLGVANKTVENLTAEVRELKKPKRTPGQEDRYRQVDEALKKLSTDAIALLKHLQIHGQLVMGMYSSILPEGMSRARAEQAFVQLYQLNLISRKQQGQTGDLLYEVSPGMSSAIDELLYDATQPDSK